MADNIALNAGSGGQTLRSEDVSGNQVQQVKPVFGGDGVANRVEYDVPLPVQGAIINAALAKGSKLRSKRLFGSNDAVGTTEEPIWTPGGTSLTGFLSTATTLRVASGGNANDDSAGTGARTVSITGLNGTMDEVTETLTLAGASASAATSNSYLRLLHAEVSGVGTYGNGNAGDITIEETGASAVMGVIPAGHGVTRAAIYTIPNNVTGLLMGYDIFVDDADECIVNIYQRKNADTIAAPMGSKQLLFSYRDVKDKHVSVTLPVPLLLSEKTDIWAAGAAVASSCEVSVQMNILLLDD